ncbi:TonB-dependent receptor domain-containing protein [Salinimonas lutimaris]|uniref:TonB-dependent receptor domain-containing protein n=1 Tax=Salinimonas lutimaris TaxID=914153 RepID=UPI0010C12026|nr:TonB-dependent receptor [Salinimonas lutimaris]
MFTNSKLAKSVKLACAFGAASAALLTANMAVAQEDAAAAEQDVEKISVTGSRIRKVDFVSNAPVATVGEEQFSLTATVNTESLLNTLPQVVPGLDRTSNNPGNGTATVDLRGLGTNRTLVLINGTRAVPTTASGTVDINSIPTALIKDVEVLTGGASAVYGSDAVAGVVNFILKDDFEGVQLQSGYEVTEQGDAEIYNADFTIGGNFADGKGNVVFNVSFTDRKELFQGDRDFSTFAQFDDGVGGLFNGGSSGVPSNAIFSAGFADFAPDSQAIIFNQDGSVRPFVGAGDNNDFYNFAPVNYIQLPQERHQISALGSYELSDNAEVYGRAMFTDSRVPQQLAATPIFQTTTFSLDNNPFLTTEAQQLLSGTIGDDVDTDGDGIADTATALVRRRLLEVGPRRSEETFQSYQMQVGVRGSFGDSAWTYDAYYQTGKATNSSAQLGNVNRDRFDQALLLASEDGNVIVDADGNPSCADTSANGSTVACAPMNIFGEGNISEDAAAYLRTAVASQAVFDQKLFGANIAGDSGEWFELPGGPLGIAFGYEHRKEDFEFLPSQDLAAGTIAGFNGAPPVEGGYTSSEWYAEAYLPILFGEEWAESLDVELAYRSADYSTAGTAESYKISASWAPVDEVRFRAGFNTAVRAPNISELFSPAGEGFPGAADPCSASGAPANPSAELSALCQATGVPADAVFGASLNPASGQVRNLVGGNPELGVEEADTLTVGVVLTPTDDFSVSLDYFDIEIEDVISTVGTNNTLDLCYNSAAGGVGSTFCNNVTRRADGTIDFVTDSFQNAATRTLKGYDLIASYSIDAGPGALSLDYLGTYTAESDFFAFPGADAIECAGNFGLDCGEPLPEYKHRLTVKYGMDDFTVQMLWRYVGEVEDDDAGTDYAVETISAHSYFDLMGTYYVSDNYKVTAGVDNLFDKQPPIMGDNAQQANTYPATYDVFGRTYYVRLTATF